MIGGQKPPPVALDIDADRHNKLVAFALSMWRDKLERYFPLPQLEVRVEGRPPMDRGGVLDLVSIDLTHLSFLDWKTGMSQESYEAQMRGLAWLTFHQMPEIQNVSATVVYVAHWQMVTYRWSRDQLADYGDHLEGLERRYSTGPHCSRCSRSQTCEPRRQWEASCLEIVRTQGSTAIDHLPAEVILDILTYLGKRISDARLALRERVKQEGGQLMLADGSALALEPVSSRQINAAEAYPSLRRHLDDDELLPCLRMPVGDTERALAAKLGWPRTREIMDELELGGAITRNTHYKLVHQEMPDDDDRSSDPPSVGEDQGTVPGGSAPGDGG